MINKFRRRIDRLRKGDLPAEADEMLDLIEDLVDEIVTLEDIVDGCVERLNYQERELDDHLHS